MRSHMIEWLKFTVNFLKQEDESLIFTAMTLCDQYLSTLDFKGEISAQNYQLTCLACLLIASKKLEIYPFDIEICLRRL
jgi:hypothetical protein